MRGVKVSVDEDQDCCEMKLGKQRKLPTTSFRNKSLYIMYRILSQNCVGIRFERDNKAYQFLTVVVDV